ncbi:MAG: hypothetical protein CL850_00620 [Crocinitomicaceae bacterium]|nr:hypothetical protein [Crocinitomicaceae bacterium]|tara:strand:+ start:949 stop:2493 length:1545 start_codon:yes stop_codon:yes gene_type:complete
MKKTYFFFIALVIFCLVGCENRKPLSWETDVFLPLLDDRIGWLEFVEDSLDIVLTDGNPARIVLNQGVEFTSGTIAPVLPDTLIEKNIGIGNIPVDIPVPTEYPFILQEDEIPIINLGGSSGAYLREVVVTSGEMVFTVENSIGGILDMSYYLTCCTINGEQVGIDLEIPAGTDDNIGFASGSLSLENAVFDLTGSAGVSNNLLTTYFEAQGSQLNEEIFFANSQDNIKVTIQFQNFEVKSALGYFGNLDSRFSEEELITDTVPLPNAIIQMDGAIAKLKLENTIGADIRLTFDSLNFDGLQLQHPSIYDVHDMARAQWNNGQLLSTTNLELDLMEEESTLGELLEMMPEKLEIVGDIELNPYGDVSLGNDYIDVDMQPNINILLELPIHVGFDGLLLEDSFEIDPIDSTSFDGRLLVDFWSTFPVQVESHLVYTVNNTSQTEIVRDVVIDPNNMDLGQDGHGFVEIPANDSLLVPGATVDVTVYVSTEGAVVFDGTEEVRVQIRAEGTYLIKE